MPTFEGRTGIGKPKRARQKPIAAPKGPKPTKQRRTPKAKRPSPAVVRKRATIPGQGLPHIPIPGVRPRKSKVYLRPGLQKAKIGAQPKLKTLTRAEKTRENLSGQGYTPPKYGPAGQQTTGEKIVTLLTGVSPTSQKPGSLTNAALSSGLALASLGGSEIAAVGTRAATSALKAGATASDAAKAAQEAVTALKEAKVAERAGKAASATETEQKAFYAKKLRTPEQTATRSERAAQAVKGTPKRVVRRVKATPKATAKKAFSAPSPESRTARALSGSPQGAHALSAVAAIPKAHAVSSIVASEVNALRKKPGKTLATTARVVPQLPAAAITPVAAAIESAKTGSLKPLGGVAKQYADYAELYSKLAGPKGTQVAESQLGLLPAITAGLGAYGVTKEVRKLRPKAEKAPPLEPRRIRKAREDMNNESLPDEVRRAARDKVRQAQTETRRSAHAGRKRSAVNTATMRESAQAKFGAEGGKKVYRGMREAASHKIPGGKLREHDLVRYLGTEGLIPGGGMRKASILRELERRRAALKPSKKKLSKLDIHDRSVIDAILQHPEVLDSPRIGPLADQFRTIGHGRSIERHTEETGQRQTTPSPADELIRTQKVARAEGIPLHHEAVPHELRHLKPAKSKGNIAKTPAERVAEHPPVKPGRDMAKALRKQARGFQADARQARATGDEKTAALYEKAAEERLNVVDRHRRAQGLLKDAARVDAGRTVTRRIEVPKGEQIRGRAGADVPSLEKIVPFVRGKGKPGITIQNDYIPRFNSENPGIKHVVYRDANGDVRGVYSLTFGNPEGKGPIESSEIVVDPKLRRQGIATKLIRAAHDAGLPVTKLGGNEDFTGEGAALAHAMLGKAGEIRVPVTAKELRAEAADLKKQANAADQKLADEHLSAVQAAIERKGYSQPFYAPERDVTKAKGLTVAGEYNVGRKGKKERFRSQTLASQGRIEQSGAQLMEGLRAQRFWMEQRAMDKRFINEEMARHPDGKLIVDTEENLNAMREAGDLPSSGALVPLSELAPAIQRDPALRALAEEARIKASIGPKGRSLYFFSRSRAAWDEHRAQNELAGRAVRYARVIGRAQSALLIGTSPIWFTLQLAATPLWLAFSHTNPGEYARQLRNQHDIYLHAPGDVKASLHGIFGSNPADVIGSQLTRNALDPQHFNRAHDAFRLTYKTPVGRMIHDIAENLRGGGPLIAGNRRYEAAWRHLAGLMEMDRVLLKDPKSRERVTNFAEETSRLQDVVYQQTEELRKMSAAERATYFVDHPSTWREVQQRLEDSLGSWTHLTKAERNATSVLVFYPFLRASMRWLFYSAPKNHPWKLAIAANLAQSNAATFQKESKGRPSYFASWGNLPIYGASGKVSNFVNVQRFAPGANALIQAIGGGQQSLLSIFTSPLQPVIGNTITAAAGQTPFGSASQESFGGQMAQNALSLSPFTRAVEHGGIGPIKAPFPYSPISQAFRKIQGQPSGIMGILNPAVVQSPEQVQEAQRLSNNLKIAAYSHADAQADVIAGKLTPKQAGAKRQKAQKAQKAINKELVQLHLETSKSQKKKSKQIGTKLGKLSQQEYQQPSGGGGPWSGSSGPSPWGSTSGKSPWG